MKINRCFLILAALVIATPLISQAQVKSVAGCAQALTDELSPATRSEDQINKLIQDLVALKQKADEARANGQGPRNNYQLMFEDQYRDALKEMPYMGARFTEAYVAARSGHQQSVEQEQVERAKRVQQTRGLKNYKISKRSDLTWSEPLSSKLAVKNLSHVAFYSISLGRVLKLKVKSRDSRLGHTADVYSAVVVSENRFLTTSYDHTAILWEVDSLGKASIVSRMGVAGNKNAEVGHTYTVRSAVVVTKNRFLTSSYDHTAILWEVDSVGQARIVSRFGVIDNQNSELGHTDYVCAAVVVSENRFLTTSWDHTAILWEVNSEGKARIVSRLGVIKYRKPDVGHTNDVLSAVLVSENRFLTTSSDHTAILWEVDSLGQARIVSRLGVAGNSNPEVGHTAYLSSALVVTANRFLTTSRDRTAILWEVDSLGKASIVSRLGVIDNEDPEVGHTYTVASAAHLLVDGELIISTRDESGRELIWEPEYASDGGEL